MLTTTLCAAPSAAGLAVALQTAYRRRFLRATRIAAASLLPVGLALAGLVTLGRRVGTAVGDWAADLVLKPTVWTGFAVLACSALLYGITRLIGGRGAGGRDGEHGRETAASAVPGAPAPALPPSSGPSRSKRRGSGDSGLSDFADVEEILRRRGI
ncbi:hypothetical protein [Streptomyces sp. HPF1205]|uniref:hypothetical protein n=1 Tax=Streptomyces sp. HPF1205 TaxID=2873262 RepID=UPI001CECE4C2|nr:hypothetical protein [Streptomyces sp. HPF1205]